jgi:hypothetical protein
VHALRCGSLRCVCGSGEVFARPGFFGKVGIGIGFTRYACRNCRRRFWLRTSLRRRAVAARHRPGYASVVSAAAVPEPTSLDSALPDPDREVNAQPLPPPDLQDLDDQLDQVRKKKPRGADRA